MRMESEYEVIKTVEDFFPWWSSIRRFLGPEKPHLKLCGVCNDFGENRACHGLNENKGYQKAGEKQLQDGC